MAIYFSQYHGSIYMSSIITNQMFFIYTYFSFSSAIGVVLIIKCKFIFNFDLIFNWENMAKSNHWVLKIQQPLCDNMQNLEY